MVGDNVNRGELKRIGRELSRGYPFNDFDELSRFLGGDDATVKFDGKPYRVGDARRLLPSEVFPINSEDEFVTKIEYLASRSPGRQPDDGKQQSPGSQPRGAEQGAFGIWC